MSRFNFRTCGNGARTMQPQPRIQQENQPLPTRKTTMANANFSISIIPFKELNLWHGVAAVQTVLEVVLVSTDLPRIQLRISLLRDRQFLERVDYTRCCPLHLHRVDVKIEEEQEREETPREHRGGKFQLMLLLLAGTWKITTGKKLH